MPHWIVIVSIVILAYQDKVLNQHMQYAWLCVLVRSSVWVKWVHTVCIIQQWLASCAVKMIQIIQEDLFLHCKLRWPNLPLNFTLRCVRCPSLCYLSLHGLSILILIHHFNMCMMSLVDIILSKLILDQINMTTTVPKHFYNDCTKHSDFVINVTYFCQQSCKASALTAYM